MNHQVNKSLIKSNLQMSDEVDCAICLEPLTQDNKVSKSAIFMVTIIRYEKVFVLPLHEDSDQSFGRRR